ncbi:MAG: sulfurtransferase TusA family protein [Aggregatilineales bacterium]
MSEPENPRSVDSFESNLVVCYEVLLYLSGRIMRLPPGTPFTFVTGDPDAAKAIPPWCDTHGYALLSYDQQPDGRWQFVICR